MPPFISLINTGEISKIPNLSIPKDIWGFLSQDSLSVLIVGLLHVTHLRSFRNLKPFRTTLYRNYIVHI